MPAQIKHGNADFALLKVVLFCLAINFEISSKNITLVQVSGCIAKLLVVVNFKVLWSSLASLSLIACLDVVRLETVVSAAPFSDEPNN